MQKVLLAVDGSEHSDRAVQLVAEFIKAHGAIDVHVANVEPEPVPWQTRGMEDQAIEAHLTSRAHQSMKSAQEILKSAGVQHHAHACRGEVAPALLALANKLRCDAIVIGTRGLGAVSGIALGSVTTKLLHLTSLPVICVKQPILDKFVIGATVVANGMSVPELATTVIRPPAQRPYRSTRSPAP